MSAATLQTSSDSGNFAVPGDRDPGSRADEAAATGPQRSLEASSFISIHTEVGRVDAGFEALPLPCILSYRDGSGLVVNGRARTLLQLGESERLRSLSELQSHAQLTDPEGAPVAIDGERTTIVAHARIGDDTRRLIIETNPIIETGERIGLAITLTDVTERLLDDEMGDDLLGRASHDLRTPLTALKASAQLIGRGFERLDENARQRTLGLLLAQIDKLSARIDEVMDASRIRRGRIDLHPENIDLAAVLRELVAELSAIPGMPKCELRAPESLPAHADRARVRQILKRLSIDAASRGTEQLTIEATATDANVTVTIAVSGEAVEDARHRTAKRLAAKVFSRLGGSAVEDRARRLVLTLPRSR